MSSKISFCMAKDSNRLAFAQEAILSPMLSKVLAQGDGCESDATSLAVNWCTLSQLARHPQLYRIARPACCREKQTKGRSIVDTTDALRALKTMFSDEHHLCPSTHLFALTFSHNCIMTQSASTAGHNQGMGAN